MLYWLWGTNHKTVFTFVMMMMMKGLMSWDAASTQTTNLSEEKGEPKRNRAEAPLLTSVTPYRLAKPATPVTRVSLVKYWVNSLPHHVAAWLWEVTPANNLRRLFGKTDQRYYSKCSVVSLDGWVKCPRWRQCGSVAQRVSFGCGDDDDVGLHVLGWGRG